MVDRWPHEGTSHRSSDLLKIFVKMGASWSAQDFRQTGVTQSGFGAFFLFCFRKTWCTSFSLIWIAGVGKRGVAGGVIGCVERCPEQVWGVFFKPTVELIQIVCQLLILHTAGGWCLVVGCLLQTFPHFLVQNTHCRFNQRVCLCICYFFLSSWKVIWKPRYKFDYFVVGIHSCFIKALGVINSSMKAAWFSTVMLANMTEKTKRPEEWWESGEVGVKRKEWTDFLRASDAIFLHSSPAWRVTRRLAALWQCRGQEVNRHVVHREQKLIVARRWMARSKVKVTLQQGRHRWRAAHFLRQTVMINQIPTAERKQFNPQACSCKNWYKLGC